MDEDDFFDANDEIVDENEMVGDIATANLAQHLFMQNKFDESKELVNPEDKDGFSLRDLSKNYILEYFIDRIQTFKSTCITTTPGQRYQF